LLGLKLNDKPILDVGAGRTTICDVKIKKRIRNLNEIHVDSHNYKDFTRFLRYMIQSPEKISIELQYAIKNMVGFRNHVGEDSFDYQRGLLDDNDNKIHKFISKCRVKAGYGSRVENLITNENMNAQIIKEWAKTNFHQINTGTHSSFGIPKEVTIHLSYQLFPDTVLWNKVNYIIDTKGLDLNGQYRTTYPNRRLIEIYCTSFVSGPEANLVQKIQASRNERQNKFLLLLPKNDEPLQVNGADECYHTGVEIKIQEVTNNTRNFLDKDNILFYDSLLGNSTQIINKIFS
jgi:hypothetical protein